MAYAPRSDGRGSINRNYLFSVLLTPVRPVSAFINGSGVGITAKGPIVKIQKLQQGQLNIHFRFFAGVFVRIWDATTCMSWTETSRLNVLCVSVSSYILQIMSGSFCVARVCLPLEDDDS